MDKATGRVTDEIEYMTADVEDEYIVGQANEPVDENGCFVNERITCRHRNEIISTWTATAWTTWTYPPR